MSGPSPWVSERRLRPIYELLDLGNNKKVVAEADRVLKKQPNFSCAKVLKALALIRMNKPQEARQILEPVAQEVPTDDGTIQALSICYRELDEPFRLCSILEAACEKEKSEELLTHCFMSLVRISDYNKMYQISTTLYKLFNKATYFGWLLASLFLKYENSDQLSEAERNIPLELASRMVDKFYDFKGGPLEDNLLELILLVLDRRRRWNTMLSVLKHCGYPSSNFNNDPIHQAYCRAMQCEEKSDELYEYLKATYLKNRDDYALLKQLIDTFHESKSKQINSMLDDMVDNSPNRTACLADLYYCFHIADSKAMPKERIMRDLQQAVLYSVDKPSFYSDIMDYFKLISRDMQFEIVKAVATESDEQGNFNTIPKIIRDVNYEIVLKEFLDKKDNELNRIKQANVCFGKYLVCHELMDSLRTDENLRTKESDYHDQYLVVAAISLLTEAHRAPTLLDGGDLVTHLKSHLWTKIEVESCKELSSLIERLISERKAENDSSALNNLEDEFEKLGLDEVIKHSQGHFSDKEALILFAICILEYGLVRSPYNYSMRILLSNAYKNFGAVSVAIKAIQGLDLKHVQWDTLGYLILPTALTSGTYTDAMKMLVAADSMYSSYRRESMEHVIAAYKYGSFGKIQEFMRFREQLMNSTQAGMTYAERRLMELMMLTGTSQDLQKFVEGVNLELVQCWIHTINYTDNRDFTVLQFFDETVDIDFFRELSSDQDHYLLKMRMILLSLLVYLLRHPKGVESASVRERFNNIMKLFTTYAGLWVKVYETKVKGNEFSIPQLHGVFPGRNSGCFEMCAPKYLLEQIKYVKEIVVDRDKLQFSVYQAKITEHCDALLKVLRENYEEFMNSCKITNMDKYILHFHCVLETFSFSRIVLEAAINASKHNADWMKIKGRQREKPAQQYFKKNAATLVATLMGKFKELHECFKVFIYALKARPLPRLTHMQTSMRDLISESFLVAAFPSTFDVAQKNIRDSHLIQLEEMNKLTASLIEYIRNNLEIK